MPNRINVTKSSMPDYNDYCSEIRELWDSRWLTNMGIKHQQLQEKLKEYLDVEKIDLLTNGHMALELSSQALNLPTGGEVITSPYTFASTTHAIVRNGLEPVFCDINPTDFTIDVSRIESLITEKTCAIVPIHVYGNVCDVEAINEIAQKYNLRVIYDAAHAFGVRYKNRGIGSFGDVSCFSFHATKVFNTIEGGAVCFHDDSIGSTIYSLKNFGIRGPECVDGVGANAKMNEFCAAMGLCNLRIIDQEIEKRRIVYERYKTHLGDVKGLTLNAEQKDIKRNYSYFPVLFDKAVFGASRDEVFEALGKEGIGARKYFYPLTNTFECFHGKYDVGKTPVAQRISKQVLTLPMYADLDLKDVDIICKTILDCRNIE